MRRFLILFLAGVFLFISPARTTPANGQQPGTTGQQTPAEKYFTDVELTNQDGRKMRLYSDLMKGKIVIINSFFSTEYVGSTPVMNQNLKVIQNILGDRVGKDVIIFSITVDPVTDTPAQLKDYARRIGAKPGWYFLTGDKTNVEVALRKLGQYVENKQDHLNIIIIGNEPTGLWKKAFGLAKSDELMKVVESVINDKQ